MTYQPIQRMPDLLIFWPPVPYVIIFEFNVIIRRRFGKNINFDSDDIILGYKYENVNDKVVLEINYMIIKFKQFVFK